MVGHALVRRLQSENCEVLTVDRGSLDLRRQEATEAWVQSNRPNVVIVAAGVVGGIAANDSFPVDFLYDNLAIASNVIRASMQVGASKLLFLGSSCMYPRDAPQPMAEASLFTGQPEPTNQWFTMAKLAGMKLCQACRRQHGVDFITVIPTNAYGPGDNYDPEHSHVPAALIRRMHEAKLTNAKTVTVWGTGRALREFLFVDDLADGCIFALRRYSEEAPLNLGSGEDVAVAQFARLVAETVGYQGELIFDTSKPDGMPRKFLDGSKLAALGWRPETSLPDGLAAAYRDFVTTGGRVPTARLAAALPGCSGASPN
jgi:GDP-L-fucose synthase